MIESWLRAAERIVHLAAVSDAKTIGILGIDGDVGVSTISRMVCRALSGGKSEALLVDLAGPLGDQSAVAPESAEGPCPWRRSRNADDGFSTLASTPTPANRNLFNDAAALRQTWRDELRSHSKLVVDLPPVLHGRSDLLSPLAAAASCDAVFLVCMQEQTAGWRLAEAVALLRASRANVAGILLNARDSEMVEDISTDWTPVSTDEAPPEVTPVGRLLQAAWRRRYLILIPILVMLPLSVVAAKLLPVPYVAKALLLLQEPGVEGPVGTTFAVSERIEERVPGLESLLKSHRVLSPALADLQKESLAPPEPPGAIKGFQERLSLKLVGLDILEIDLRGNTQEGLGRQLEEVVTRFLDALATDQGAMTAGQLLIQDRLAAWRSVEKAHAAALTRLPQLLPDGMEKSSAQLAELESQLAGKRSELTAVDAELTRSTGTPKDPGAPSAAESKRDQLAKEVARLEAESRNLRDRIDEYLRLESDKPRLEDAVATAERQYAALSEQYERGAVDYPQRLLDAPERIRIIDPPRDPEAPEKSRLLYVLFGVAASIVLGGGLAWGAEQTDPSLRDRHEFAAVAGVPVVAHLPKFMTPGGEVPKKSRRRWLWLWGLALIILIAVSILLWHQLAPAETTAASADPWSQFLSSLQSWFGGAKRPQSALWKILLSPFGQ